MEDISQMNVELGVTLLKVAFIVYLVASVCYVTYLVSKAAKVGMAGTGLLIFGVLFHIASVVVRTIAAGRPPFMNVYEFIMSFTLGFALVYLVVEFTSRNRMLGAFIVPLIAMFAFVDTRMSSEVNAIMPALRSIWRVPHITTALLAYAGFGTAFMLGIMQLIQTRAERKGLAFWLGRLPASKVIDQITYRTVAFGFFMLTFGIITGSVWAQMAWGKYWTWDPKEVWSAITWLIYAAYLHTRTAMGWRGSKSAVLAIIGFMATLFTLFGVTYLMQGMHSYG